jgi:hypothetical protein
VNSAKSTGRPVKIDQEISLYIFGSIGGRKTYHNYSAASHPIKERHMRQQKKTINHVHKDKIFYSYCIKI